MKVLNYVILFVFWSEMSEVVIILFLFEVKKFVVFCFKILVYYKELMINNIVVVLNIILNKENFKILY